MATERFFLHPPPQKNKKAKNKQKKTKELELRDLA
jgi:hypothetical protein